MYLVTMAEDSIEVEDKRQVVNDGHYVVLKRTGNEHIGWLQNGLIFEM
jgi:hypothetical protein